MVMIKNAGKVRFWSTEKLATQLSREITCRHKVPSMGSVQQDQEGWCGPWQSQSLRRCMTDWVSRRRSLLSKPQRQG